MDEERKVRVRITGRVQGVWFRAWTAEAARARKLSGWVRNRRDGSVEAVFAGPTAAVDEMVAACSSGPPAARVADVRVNDEVEAVAPGFRTLPTR